MRVVPILLSSLLIACSKSECDLEIEVETVANAYKLAEGLYADNDSIRMLDSGHVQIDLHERVRKTHNLISTFEFKCFERKFSVIREVLYLKKDKILEFDSSDWYSLEPNVNTHIIILYNMLCNSKQV